MGDFYVIHDVINQDNRDVESIFTIFLGDNFPIIKLTSSPFFFCGGAGVHYSNIHQVVMKLLRVPYVSKKKES